MVSETSEAQIHFRHFDASGDIPHLAQLLAEIEQVDHAGEDISEETLKAQLTLPGHDPFQDRWVVTTSDNERHIIGFSCVWKVPQNAHADIYVGVHPLWRRKGLGCELLQRTLARAQTLQPQEILASVDTQHQEAMNFLQKHAFSPVAAYTEMCCAHSMLLPPPDWPTGYTIHAYNPLHDFPVLLEMYNTAFQGLWGHWETVTAADLQDILTHQNPAGIFLLHTHAGKVVGTCRGEISEPLSARRGRRMGYLDCPGVVPGHRANGLYFPLLLHAAHWVRNQETVDIEVESWGDDPQVIAQYEEVGFTRVRQQITYHLPC